jgi:hypothetical protein
MNKESAITQALIATQPEVVEFIKANGSFDGISYFLPQLFKLRPSPFIMEVVNVGDPIDMLIEAQRIISQMKSSMMAHPDHKEGSEFDDFTTSAQEIEDKIEAFLVNVQF